MSDLKYQEIIDIGTAALVGGFSSSIEELFKKPLVISRENNENPFPDLPKHIQVTIIQKAFQKGLAQSLASTAILANDQVSDKEVLSAGTVVLKHFFYEYVKAFRGQLNDQRRLDPGPNSRDDSSSAIPSAVGEGSQNQIECPVLDSHVSGQNGNP